MPSEKLNNIKSYYSHRNNNVRGMAERSVLAEREVRTLITVLGCDDNNTVFRGMKIADLGCGDKFLERPLALRGANYRGIDIDECNLEVDRFPLEDQSCDLVISLSVIEHLHDPSHFLFEIKRVMKPGAALWMDTPDISACGNEFWNDPTHVHPYTRVSLRFLFEMHGFTDILIAPNYRCKPKKYYLENKFNFFRARYLMPFTGLSNIKSPEFLKGRCSGLFIFARI